MQLILAAPEIGRSNAESNAVPAGQGTGRPELLASHSTR